MDRISPAQIRRWFDAYSQTAPGGANHALDLLRQIMNFAVACGHIDANPARGVKRNRRSALTRFLSREEIGRLHKVLDDQSGESRTQQADIIRLLLLTGCRRSEIVQLRWSEVRDDVLALADSKTGPRNVPLTIRGFEVMRALRKGQAGMFALQGGIVGEARIVERAFGLGPCALTEAMALLQDRLANAES